MKPSPSLLPSLGDNRFLRYGAFAGLYVAQGLPEGLLYVALPAWLARHGAEAAAIGAYVGVILLPWSFKLAIGPLMDRFSFLAMGRRRPWVIGAQLAMACALAALAATPDPASNIGRLTLIGFLINLCGAFQDVAVDGMAIDVVPRDEQPRANGLMWGGKTLGIAAAAAVSGTLLSSHGLALAAGAVAAILACVMLLPLLLRERRGERLMPWSAGAASQAAAELQLHSFATIMRRLLRAVLTPTSLLFAAGTFTALMGYGLYTAALPVMAVQHLGWADTEYTNTAAAAGLAGGVFAMAAGGAIVERMGLLRALLAALLLTAALHGAMAAATGLWDVRPAVLSYIFGFKLMFVTLSVAVYAAAMRLCTPQVAATQFALYMACVNLGTSAGALLLGPARAAAGYAGVMLAMAGFALLAVGVFKQVDLAQHPGRADGGA